MIAQVFLPFDLSPPLWLANRSLKRRMTSRGGKRPGQTEYG